MIKQTTKAALAAILILLGFGILAYFVPMIMLALGEYSQILAVIFPIHNCFKLFCSVLAASIESKKA